MFSSQLLKGMPSVFSKVLVSVLLLLAGSGSLQAKNASAGLAWQIQGVWQIAGKGAPIRSGDAIEPASLLQPEDSAGNHSITILLPDGQRLLYECFTVVDCARGFRVPSLIRKPDPFALDMLARIGTVLSNKRDAPNERHPAHGTPTSRQQAVAVLTAANRVHVAGLVADLPRGHYTYDLRALNPARPPQLHLALEKTAPSIELALPAPGLYNITITDALNAPRVDLLLAAIRPGQSAHFQSFQRARATMEAWNDDYAGWPIDDFLRAYLESLMLARPTVSGKMR
jgi:hypothetical protein